MKGILPNGFSFNKGYTEKGFAESVFHLHLRYMGDYEPNRDGYTNAKTEFVRKYTEKAKLIYGNRY